MIVSKSIWTSSNAPGLIPLSVTVKIRRPLLRRIFCLLPCSAFVLSFAVAFAQTNSATPGKNNSVYAELAKAPQKAIARSNPLATDPDAIPAGAKLFARHCAECHGDMADGGKKGPSLLAPEVQQATPGTLFWLLSNGVVRRGMPVWSKLPEPQRWQLVTFIKSLPPASQSAPNAENSAHP
jgi:mono/diheme cytochrome c family protein